MFGRIIIFLSHLASGSCKIELINSVLNVLRIWISVPPVLIEIEEIINENCLRYL